MQLVSMEYDSESNCDNCLKDLEASKNLPILKQVRQIDQVSQLSNSVPWSSVEVAPLQSQLDLRTTNRNLSSQVMEYCHKYSQNANLDQYFSLPASNIPSEALKYYYGIYKLNSKLGNSRQDCIGEEYSLQTYVPKERRRWVRPPIIGQSSNADTSSRYIQPLIDPESPSPDLKQTASEIIPETKNECQDTLSETIDRKVSSPTSSIASHKPLEWDSGADVGYFNTLPHNKQNNKNLSTIERMALARGCSAALRLDPEGTNESVVSVKYLTIQSNVKSLKTPNANSTRLIENISGSESEIDITPIVKNHLPSTITGDDIKSEEKCSLKNIRQDFDNQSFKNRELNLNPNKSYLRKIPVVQHHTEGKKGRNKQHVYKENFCQTLSPLKKSTSMNMIAAPDSKITLKRSQSELNIFPKDKNKILPLIYNSTSSIATVVNKPMTCDKVIQTSPNTYTQESVGIQVSALEEDKPPLPKRGTSLQKSLQSILKSSKGTYKVQNLKKDCNNRDYDINNVGIQTKENKICHSSSDFSQNKSTSITPQPDDMENITGKANSFEYFPGHIYENVPNGSDSHVSSIDTGESNSTLPNTSSSMNEKLWGDSDSLVRDLERSVNILKALVDANKCDKQVKKRLIHHVVKRLVTAKYTDDKIEHNLEDNVPWNPDDARKKVYRTEVLHALTKKHSLATNNKITDNKMDNWKQQINQCIQKPVTNTKERIERDTLGSSSNSDRFDGNTDRTEMDGRKARMGLRTDDCQQSSSPMDLDKSESSECFFPRRKHKNGKSKNTLCIKEKCKLLQENDSTTTTSSSLGHNQILLNTIMNSRRTSTESNNNSDTNMDWRLPTTNSERQFELKKCRNSHSGDLKLVNYAEMEKRNQLIWITNEITHLCNLKKLLEQPRRLERPKISPRKSKSTICKPKPTVLTCMHRQNTDAEYTFRNVPDVPKNPLNEQWSSHCNLATCQTVSNGNALNDIRIKKRNSFAQTTTETVSAHSKSGEEITSLSNLYCTPYKLTSTGVQTSYRDILPIHRQLNAESDCCIKCPFHKTVLHSQITHACVNEEKKSKKNSFQSTSNVCTHCPQNKSQDQAMRSRCQDTTLNSEFLKEDDSCLALESTILGSISSNNINCLEPTRCYKDQNSNRIKQKETKDKINASKSKCMSDKATHTSQCGECKCEDNVSEGKRNASKKISKQCQCFKQTIVASANNIASCSEKMPLCTCKNACTCGKKEENIEDICKSTNNCKCRNGVIHDIQSVVPPTKFKTNYYQDDRYITVCTNKKKSIKLCECSSDCSCENKTESEMCMPNVSYDSWSNAKTECNKIYCSEHCSKMKQCQTQNQPYSLVNTDEGEPLQLKVQNRMKCNCNKDCSSTNKIKAVDNKIQDINYSIEARFRNESNDNDSNKNCKCYKICGKTYQNSNCCYHQTYPKPVAYELSYTKENSEQNISNINILPKVPLSNIESNVTRSDKCTCDTTKKDSSNKSCQQKTLQDYLSKNKPEFVDNAEIRRQYMSEICHLRQLKKEKRTQLLAMASTSNLINFPRLSKPIGNVQRRISDEEMKERLRKRYLRLNEVRIRRQRQEKQEEVRRNKLMAKIFCKKLQQRVLRGQVDLSQSVSVISNL